MTIFELWILTTVIPGLGNVVSSAALFLVIISIGKCLIFVITEGECGGEYIKKHWIKMSFAILAISSISALMPNEKQMLLIAGGYTATNNEQIKQMPTKAAKAVNAWLDAVTEAAEPAKK